MKIKMEDLPDGLIPESSVLAGFRGSIAHNTYISPTDPNGIDDIDLMAVYMAPVEYYIGLGRGRRYRKGSHVIDGKFDCARYELKHFINLALKSNPSILSLLWIKEEHYLKVSDDMRVLLDNKDLFSSKQAYTTFTGYATSQLKKMEKFNYEGYMGVKRKSLVDRYGYDCKNASHLIRLLKMGAEFLDSGKLKIYRTIDARMLTQIKAGMWTLDDVKQRAAEELDNVKSAFAHSKLPDYPNREKVEELLMKIIGNYVYKEYYGKEKKNT